LSEDQVPSPSATGSNCRKRQLLVEVDRNERIRRVLGAAHLGQQVMEVVFFSSDKSRADARGIALSELTRSRFGNSQARQ
jgi:hypothetical protein